MSLHLHATIGDGPTRRVVQLLAAAGPVDLTSVSTVTWTATGATSARTISGSCTVVTAATGTVSLTLTAAHLSSAQGAIVEDYSLHFVATWPDAVETFPTPFAGRLTLDPR